MRIVHLAVAALLSATLASPVAAQPTTSRPNRAAARPGASAPAATRPATRAPAATRPGVSAPAAPRARPNARARVLRERIGLDDAQATKVERIMDRFVPDKRAAQGEIREARRSLRELLRSNSDDQKAYARALDRLRAGHRALQNARDRELDAIRKELTPKQQAMLLGTVERLRRQTEARARTASTPRAPRRP